MLYPFEQSDPLTKPEDNRTNSGKPIDLFSPSWEQAIKSGLIIQAIFAIFFALMLDGGWMLNIYKVAWFGQFLVSILLIFRRRRSPTKFDLMFVRYGILFSTLIALILKIIIRPNY